MPETNNTEIVAISPKNLEDVLTDVYGTIKATADELKALGIKLSAVDTLPITGDSKTIYLVPAGKYIWDDTTKTIVADPNWVAPTDPAKNLKDEFIWTTDRYEPIGTIEVDLSNYIRTDELRAMTDSEVTALISKVKGETA